MNLAVLISLTVYSQLCGRVKQKGPARLLKRSLVSQAASIFVTRLKMCPHAIPITPHPLLFPPWLLSLRPSLHLQRIACPLLKPFPLLGAHCSGVARRWLGPHLDTGGSRGVGYRVSTDGGNLKVHMTVFKSKIHQALEGIGAYKWTNDLFLFFSLEPFLETEVKLAQLLLKHL